MGDFPTLSIMLLVKVTRHDDGGGNRVEHREDPDSDHQLFQLISLGATLFNDAPDPKQRHKSSQEKHGANE